VSLKGLINGSHWVPDLQTGRYILISCPARYEIAVTGLANGSLAYLAQACIPCPQARYCSGGKDPSTPCPGGTFALTGTAASSADCLQTTFLKINIQIEEPTSTVAQPLFLQAVASAANVSVDTVFLVGATAKSERVSLVEVRIATDSVKHALLVCSSLDSTELSLAFARLGLRGGLLLSCAPDEQPLGIGNDVLVTMVIGLAVGAVLVCILGISILVKCQRIQNKEDNEMMKATKDLRRRLKIELEDGYLLGSDWTYPWQSRTSAIYLHKNCIESATKLSLLRDFNPLHFDAFCVSLIQNVQPPAGRSVQHMALYEWLLEIGKWLIQPSIKGDKLTINPESGREWTERERFAYLDKLCKCQVSENTQNRVKILKTCLVSFRHDTIHVGKDSTKQFVFE
jgi:hypothetical protein